MKKTNHKRPAVLGMAILGVLVALSVANEILLKNPIYQEVNRFNANTEPFGVPIWEGDPGSGPGRHHFWQPWDVFGVGQTVRSEAELVDGLAGTKKMFTVSGVITLTSKIVIPVDTTLRIPKGGGFDFSGGGSIHCVGPLVMPNPHSRIFFNVETSASSGTGYPSVYGHFGGLDRYMGWWLTPDAYEGNATPTDWTKEFQACVDSVVYDASDYDIPNEWKNAPGGFTTWHTSGTVHVPYGGIVLKDTITMTAFAGELRGPGGNAAYLSFQDVARSRLFHFGGNTPSCIFRNIYFHVKSDCQEGIGLFVYDSGASDFYEGTRWINCSGILEIPCDIWRVTGASWNHVSIESCNFLFNETDFPDPPQDPPTVSRVFNLNSGAKNVKFSVRNSTFIGDNQHDAAGSIAYDLKGYADSMFVENCHHESWGTIFKLTGAQVSPTFWQIGEVRGIGVSNSNSTPGVPFTMIDLPNEDWRGVVDIAWQSITAGTGASLSTAVDDARYNGTFRAGGNINLLLQAQIETFTTRADVADDLDAKWFQLYDDDGSVGVWIDVDDSGTTIPAGANALDRDIEVTGVVTGDADSAVATAVAAAINADSKYSAGAVGAVVTVTHAVQKNVLDGSDGDAGFTSFTVTQQGLSGYQFSGLGNEPKWWRYKAHGSGTKAAGSGDYDFELGN